MSSFPLSKNFGLSSSLKEEVMVTQKNQGIVSILGSDAEQATRTSFTSLRRTLSADMSSKKWLSQNGFSSLKGFTVEEVKECVVGDVQARPMQTRTGSFDVLWNSIVAQKKQDEGKELPPPYVHPLVKRSKSLSAKSLEICTESLGSETGSDGFSSSSSYPSSPLSSDSEDQDEREEEERAERQMRFDGEDHQVAARFSNHYSSKKLASPTSFPPPIPSLSCHDGASLHVRSRRDNGRLVLEAVSVPSQNNFLTERQDGRLLLSFIKQQEEIGESKEEKIVGVETETYGGCSDSEEARFVMEKEQKPDRLVVVLNKRILSSDRNQKRANNLDEVVKFEEEKVDKTRMTTVKSLPPQPLVARMIPTTSTGTANAGIGTDSIAAATSFNDYEYWWKPEPTTLPLTAMFINPMTKKPTPLKTNNNKLIVSKNYMVNDQDLVELLENKRGHNIPLLRSCKEPRRSLGFWEPHCIATS